MFAPIGKAGVRSGSVSWTARVKGRVEASPLKGLEFNTMIIASANKGIIPHSKAIMGSDSVISREGEKAEKALLYFAVTRARKNVLITGYGEMSEWLDV